MAETSQQAPSISLVGESAILVGFPNRISTSVNKQVHDLARSLRERELRGIIDIVPAYATLLVNFDAGQATAEDVVEEIYSAVTLWTNSRDKPKENSKLHVVPVQYGGELGPDLDDVASGHGLSPREVIRLHTDRKFRVHFLGFLPGFAYLGKLPQDLVTPRLATPRTRVRGGSVGLAAAQTAVYPFASPGGWRIIGQTSLPVWDPFSDMPVRFAPGDSVHFVESSHESETNKHLGLSTQVPAHPALEVISAEGMTTVQDLGRPGLAHIGLAQGGACDAYAAMIANALVGNALEAALLEMTWTGPTLRALRNVTIALTGSGLGCMVDGYEVPTGLSWYVRRGATISFTGAQSGDRGMRGYLAISGGVDVPLVLGARSTSLLASFGGYMGRAIRAGDVIGVATAVEGPIQEAGKLWPGREERRLPGDFTIRYVPYRGRGEAGLSAQREFERQTFELTEQSDRMGYRLKSVNGGILTSSQKELVSFGVVRGAIQLPPGGNPVVLNVEHQTTGGYPLLGVVAKVDFPILSHLRPGSHIRFVPVEREEANRDWLGLMREVSQTLKSVGLSPPCDGCFLQGDG